MNTRGMFMAGSDYRMFFFVLKIYGLLSSSTLSSMESS